MVPCETSDPPGILEHPKQAFAYYRREGLVSVICQEKHMGSRAVIVVCRDEGAARRRFGISGGETGICYTRTGRRFFDDPSLERELLARIRSAADTCGLWGDLDTDWLCLDCELMPWSAKAQELLRSRYAAVGAASRASLTDAQALIETAAKHNRELEPLLSHMKDRAAMADRFVAAYRRYCWPVNSVEELRLAPFHLLASQGRVHVDRDHSRHMEKLGVLGSAGAPLLVTTECRIVDLVDPESEKEGIEWWTDLTARGGEGIVVKPIDLIAHGRHGLVQPAVKCRGPEYLRLIYGPEYTFPENLARLHSRATAAKRSLALREFALGIEALERLARKEPLRRVHECVFGILALESEPVDPRL